MNSWQPTASIEHLRKRASIIDNIRAFFKARDVLEVDTPLLCHTSTPDPNIESLCVTDNNKAYYLQTSPEFAMKRLLAAGSGDIFQLCKAFRKDEAGRMHNPEFTMLEWYRLGFDHHQLMDEVDDLLQTVLQCGAANRFSYVELFQYYTEMNPHTCSMQHLQQYITSLNLDIPKLDNRDDYLQILLTHHIEPRFSKTTPTFIYDYPIEQASLAKIRPDTPPVAERFEVYLGTVELANGFHELTNSEEQRQRFVSELAKRKQRGQKSLPIDEDFLAALAAGLPNSAGVALGVDRLIMLALQATSISDVISFVTSPRNQN